MNEVVKNIIETTAKSVRVSKISQAREIFKSKLESRLSGQYQSYRDFRFSVINMFVITLGVNESTASTMFNNIKREILLENPEVNLSRDPRKIKIRTSTGKRGRPLGSKNKPKIVIAQNIPQQETEAA